MNERKRKVGLPSNEGYIRCKYIQCSKEIASNEHTHTHTKCERASFNKFIYSIYGFEIACAKNAFDECSMKNKQNIKNRMVNG